MAHPRRDARRPRLRRCGRARDERGMVRGRRAERRGSAAGNERSVDDPRHAYRDRDIARTLAQGWVSTGPGALVTHRPMHAAGRNRLFVPGRDPFLFSLPLLWDKHHIFTRLTRRPPQVLTDLVANLENVRARLSPAAERARADDAAGEYGAFRARFVAWLEDRLRLIDDGLRRARAPV